MNSPLVLGRHLHVMITWILHIFIKSLICIRGQSLQTPNQSIIHHSVKALGMSCLFASRTRCSESLLSLIVALPMSSTSNHLLATAETQHQVQCRLLLNVVVRQCTPILQLLACENQTLLVWGNTLFVLNLGLHIVDSV